MAGKNIKKNIKEWAKELKHNEKFAKKYEGLTTVEGILATAKKDGYDIKEKELMEFDLDSVAGGFLSPTGAKIQGIGVDVNKNDMKATGLDLTIKNQKVGQYASGNAKISSNISMNS